MSKENNLTDFLTDVADAIRERKGSSEKINPQNFSKEIKKLEISKTTSREVTITEEDIKQPRTIYAPNGYTGLSSVTIYTDITYPGNADIILHDNSRFPSEKSNIKSVLLHDDVTILSDNAFNGCTGMEKLTIQGNISDINNFGNNCLANCTGELVIYTTDIPDNLIPKVADNAVSSTNKFCFSKLTLSCSSVGYKAFLRCSSIVEQLNGKNIWTSIKNHAFEGCSNLPSVILSESQCKTIGNYAFRGCTSLSTFVAGPKLNTIGYMAFGECTNLYYYDFSRCESIVKISNTKTELDTEYPQDGVKLSLAGWYDENKTIPNELAIDGFRVYVNKDMVDNWKADEYWSHYSSAITYRGTDSGDEEDTTTTTTTLPPPPVDPEPEESATTTTTTTTKNLVNLKFK